MKIQAAMFRNEKKKRENQPDYTLVGEIRDDENNDTGIKIKGGGWVKKSKRGQQYLSVTIKWDDVVPEQTREAPAPEPEVDPFKKEKDDKLPF